MSEFRNAMPGYMYFVTLSVCGWIDLFTRQQYKDILITNLQYCQENEGLEIYAYVIMGSHMHLIAARTHKEDLREMLGRFKGYTSKQLLENIETNPLESRKDWLLYQFRYFARQNNQYGKYHLWQYTNYPVEIHSDEVFYQKKEYIHMNPVKEGIVLEPEHYFYSSAHPNGPIQNLAYIK